MVNFISKEIILAEMEEKPTLQFSPDFDLRKVTKEGKPGSGVLAEFVGTGDFPQAWQERRRYEVDAGRDMEPILWKSFYTEIVDSTLPEIIPIYNLGPAGVVLEEIKEGGEVKFITVDSSSKEARILQYGAGLEYSKKLRMFNQLWTVGMAERRMGTAYNALQNHIHFAPILAGSYSSNRLIDGTSLTSFLATDKLALKYQRTIENAIVNGKTDTTNPRRGPYDLLVASGDMFTVERALNRVPQQGFDDQSSARTLIQNVIAYDGWSGTRGKKATSYSGVTTGTAYLIDKGHRDEDFLSFWKQTLDMVMGNGDVSRFIEEQQVWDTWFGVYAAPDKAVAKITWPGATDGAS